MPYMTAGLRPHPPAHLLPSLHHDFTLPAAALQCPLTKAMADLMEQRAEQRGWAEDRMLSPDREGCAAMEEFLFWVGILYRWACWSPAHVNDCCIALGAAPIDQPVLGSVCTGPHAWASIA
jgi:hypothetical protein